MYAFVATSPLITILNYNLDSKQWNCSGYLATASSAKGNELLDALAKEGPISQSILKLAIGVSTLANADIL